MIISRVLPGNMIRLMLGRNYQSRLQNLRKQSTFNNLSPTPKRFGIIRRNKGKLLILLLFGAYAYFDHRIYLFEHHYHNLRQKLDLYYGSNHPFGPVGIDDKRSVVDVETFRKFISGDIPSNDIEIMYSEIPYKNSIIEVVAMGRPEKNSVPVVINAGTIASARPIMNKLALNHSMVIAYTHSGLYSKNSHRSALGVFLVDKWGSTVGTIQSLANVIFDLIPLSDFIRKSSLSENSKTESRLSSSKNEMDRISKISAVSSSMSDNADVSSTSPTSSKAAPLVPSNVSSEPVVNIPSSNSSITSAAVSSPSSQNSGLSLHSYLRDGQNLLYNSLHRRLLFAPSTFPTSENQAQELSAVLSFCGVPSAILVGHSYHWLATAKCALRNSSRVAGLMLLDPCVPAQSMHPLKTSSSNILSTAPAVHSSLDGAPAPATSSGDIITHADIEEFLESASCTPRMKRQLLAMLVPGSTLKIENNPHGNGQKMNSDGISAVGGGRPEEEWIVRNAAEAFPLHRLVLQADSVLLGYFKRRGALSLHYDIPLAAGALLDLPLGYLYPSHQLVLPYAFQLSPSSLTAVASGSHSLPLGEVGPSFNMQYSGVPVAPATVQSASKPRQMDVLLSNFAPFSSALSTSVDVNGAMLLDSAFFRSQLVGSRQGRIGTLQPWKLFVQKADPMPLDKSSEGRIPFISVFTKLLKAPWTEHKTTSPNKAGSSEQADETLENSGHALRLPSELKESRTESFRSKYSILEFLRKFNNKRLVALARRYDAIVWDEDPLEFNASTRNRRLLTVPKVSTEKLVKFEEENSGKTESLEEHHKKIIVSDGDAAPVDDSGARDFNISSSTIQTTSNLKKLKASYPYLMDLVLGERGSKLSSISFQHTEDSDALGVFTDFHWLAKSIAGTIYKPRSGSIFSGIFGGDDLAGDAGAEVAALVSTEALPMAEFLEYPEVVESKEFQEAARRFLSGNSDIGDALGTAKHSVDISVLVPDENVLRTGRLDADFGIMKRFIPLCSLLNIASSSPSTSPPYTSLINGTTELSGGQGLGGGDFFFDNVTALEHSMNIAAGGRTSGSTKSSGKTKSTEFLESMRELRLLKASALAAGEAHARRELYLVAMLESLRSEGFVYSTLVEAGDRLARVSLDSYWKHAKRGSLEESAEFLTGCLDSLSSASPRALVEAYSMSHPKDRETLSNLERIAASINSSKAMFNEVREKLSPSVLVKATKFAIASWMNSPLSAASLQSDCTGKQLDDLLYAYDADMSIPVSHHPLYYDRGTDTVTHNNMMPTFLPNRLYPGLNHASRDGELDSREEGENVANPLIKGRDISVDMEGFERKKRHPPEMFLRTEAIINSAASLLTDVSPLQYTWDSFDSQPNSVSDANVSKDVPTNSKSQKGLLSRVLHDEEPESHQDVDISTKELHDRLISSLAKQHESILRSGYSKTGIMKAELAEGLGVNQGTLTPTLGSLVNAYTVQSLSGLPMEHLHLRPEHWSVPVQVLDRFAAAMWGVTEESVHKRAVGHIGSTSSTQTQSRPGGKDSNIRTLGGYEIMNADSKSIPAHALIRVGPENFSPGGDFSRKVLFANRFGEIISHYIGSGFANPDKIFSFLFENSVNPKYWGPSGAVSGSNAQRGGNNREEMENIKSLLVNACTKSSTITSSAPIMLRLNEYSNRRLSNDRTVGDFRHLDNTIIGRNVGLYLWAEANLSRALSPREFKAYVEDHVQRLRDGESIDSICSNESLIYSKSSSKNEFVPLPFPVSIVLVEQQEAQMGAACAPSYSQITLGGGEMESWSSSINTLKPKALGYYVGLSQLYANNPNFGRLMQSSSDVLDTDAIVDKVENIVSGESSVSKKAKNYRGPYNWPTDKVEDSVRLANALKLPATNSKDLTDKLLSQSGSTHKKHLHFYIYIPSLILKRLKSVISFEQGVRNALWLSALPKVTAIVPSESPDDIINSFKQQEKFAHDGIEFQYKSNPFLDVFYNTSKDMTVTIRGGTVPPLVHDKDTTKGTGFINLAWPKSVPATTGNVRDPMAALSDMAIYGPPQPYRPAMNGVARIIKEMQLTSK